MATIFLGPIDGAVLMVAIDIAMELSTNRHKKLHLHIRPLNLNMIWSIIFQHKGENLSFLTNHPNHLLLLKRGVDNEFHSFQAPFQPISVLRFEFE